jgi:hypothetical protein
MPPPLTSLKLKINFNHVSELLCFSFSTNNSAHAFDTLRDNRERAFEVFFVSEWSRHASVCARCVVLISNTRAHTREGKNATARLRVNEIKMCIATL